MQPPNETQIGDRWYSFRKLDAKQQMQLAWKLGGRVGPYLDMRSGDKPTANFMALFLTLSQLRQEDAEFLVGTALSAVSVKQGQAWAPLTASNGAVMFNDLGPVELHTLVDIVLEYNLGPFFDTLRLNTREPKGGEQTSNSSGTQTA